MNKFQIKLKEDRRTLLKVIQVFHPEFDQYNYFRPYVQYEGLSIHGYYKAQKKGIVNMTLTIESEINHKCYGHSSDTSKIKHSAIEAIINANIEVKKILNNAGYEY